MIGFVTTLFNKIFTNEFKISVPNIRALINSCRERKQTGLIRLITDEGKSFYLLLKNGDVLNSYIVSAKTFESASPESWDSWINSVFEAYTKLIPLSPQGLLICKLLIQSKTGESKTFTHRVDIGKYLETQKQTDTLLVQLEWENSTGAVLFSSPLDSPYSLFISPETLQDQSDIAPAILNPEHPYCTVKTFGFDQSVEAWQEYLLRRVFANIYEQTLSRFQMMTGRALMDSLVRLTVAIASRHNLNINVSNYKVVDGEVFSSPQQAANNYRLLLTDMFMHFSGITGSRLLSSTLRDMVENLPVQEREMISAFSLLSEGYIYERRA
jgi:hypothetical protein